MAESEKPKLIQPGSGAMTINALKESSSAADFTIGRIEAAVTHQGCNPWAILRILFDYYSEMAEREERSDGGSYWKDKVNALIEVEKQWDSHCRSRVESWLNQKSKS